MASVTTTEARVHEKTVRVLKPHRCKGGVVRPALLAITVKGRTDHYLATEIESRIGGRGFTMLKAETQPDHEPDCNQYHVRVNGSDSSCECKGFTYRGTCRHIDALTALVKARGGIN